MRWSLQQWQCRHRRCSWRRRDPEQLFKDLQILHPIGVGGFGVVYRGLYQCASVAVKLAVTSASDSTDRASVREALVSPQLRHPNVVTTVLARGAAVTEEFLEAARAGGPDPPPQRQGSGLLLPAFVSEDGLGDPCAGHHAREGWFEALSRSGARPGKTLVLLVQEFCERGTLSHAIRQGLFRPAVPPGDPAFPQQERLARRMLLRTAAEICRGLVHLHAANVIHGDLKPANVLLAKTSDRRGFTVKVADFGMSHLLQDGSARCDSSSLGTLVYASPESMNGEHTKTSDGLRPPLPDSEWPELCALARRCMEQDPDARPSFRELESAMMDMENRLRPDAAVSLLSQADSADRLSLSLSLSGGGSGGGGGGSGGGAAEQPLSPSPWLTTSIPAEAFLQAPQPPAEQQQGGG
ncbi:hypothetical protein HYH03_014521 [Edaphochlamys debaryana]|uniref:Protein kinase domain-containing protein n=1 Tax=Edaphochlamys debaryana TaxID=47281 RepID=A0A836BTG3_9CHLO|nr:hypothetical protein HYH03_014521 [Edaphochlamys debaryana]|eukprot:KAG2486838.1 hypothetical protein HYH03_014521 [Edaphochlamys debaryana]